MRSQAHSTKENGGAVKRNEEMKGSEWDLCDKRKTVRLNVVILRIMEMNIFYSTESSGSR